MTQTVTGLTNGTTYTFKVAAINGSAPAPSPAPPPPSPSAPRWPRPRPRRHRATPRRPSPGSPPPQQRLSHHRLRGHPLHRRRRPDRAQTFVSTAVTQTVTGLTNGTTYTFKVAAINGYGTGPQSAATSAVTVGAPLAPTSPTATSGNASATVTWVAPAVDNGSAITGYVVTPSINGVAGSARTFNSTAVTQIVTGLTNGTTYTFKVAAINGSGTGPQSAASPAILVGLPAAPTAPDGDTGERVGDRQVDGTGGQRLAPSPATSSPPTSAPSPSRPRRSTRPP